MSLLTNKLHQNWTVPLYKIKQWAIMSIVLVGMVVPSVGQTPSVAIASINKESVTLSGRVVSGAQQEGVPLATIVVVGTELVVTTDAKGHFQLELSYLEEAIALNVSCSNYKDRSYTIVPNKSKIDLAIEIKPSNLILISRCGWYSPSPIELSLLDQRAVARKRKRQARKESRNNQ